MSTPSTPRISTLKPVNSPIPYEETFPSHSNSSFLKASQNCTQIITKDKFLTLESSWDWENLTKFMSNERKFYLINVCPKPWFCSEYPAEVVNHLSGDEEDTKRSSSKRKYEKTYFLKPILDIDQLRLLRLVYASTWALLSSGMIIITIIFMLTRQAEYEHQLARAKSNSVSDVASAYRMMKLIELSGQGRWWTVSVILNIISIFFVILGGSRIYLEFEEAISYARQYKDIEKRLFASKRGVMLRQSVADIYDVKKFLSEVRYF